MNLNNITKQNIFLKKIEFFPFIIISILLFSFILFKAYKVPFTADESRTYLKFIDGSFIKIFEFKEANNHFLNTFLSNLANFISGNSELSLRLPNIIAFIFYLFFSYLIINKLTNYFFKLCAFILLNTNPYLLDFFILCRGYGLSLTFIFGSIFFLFEYIEKRTINYIYLCLIFGLFSVLSNFTLLIYYISLAFTIFLIMFENNNYSFKIKPDLSNLFKNFNFKFFIFLFIYFIIIFMNIYIINIKNAIVNYDTAEEITVKIIGIEKEDELNSIKVLRGRPRSNIEYEIFDKRSNNTWTTSKKQYFRSIKIEIPDGFINKINSIDINIGDELFSYDKNILKSKIDNILEKEFNIKDLFYNKSIIPKLNELINWSGDIKCSLLALDNSYSSVIFILFTIFLIISMKLITNLIISFNILTAGQAKPLYNVSLILFIIIIFPIYSLQQQNAFFWGGKGNFINETIGSLINYSFYDKVYFKFQYQFFLILIFCLIAISVFLIIFYSKKNEIINKKFLTYIFIALSLVLICSLISLLEHFIFKIPYLKRRTAVFLIPLFYLLFIFTLYALFSIKNKFSKILLAILLMTFTSLNIFHFANSMNINYVYEWKYDTGYKEMIDDIKSIKNNHLKNKYKLLIYDEIKYSINYYINVHKIDDMEIFSDRYLKDENNLNFDFYISEYYYINKFTYMTEFKKYADSNSKLFINNDLK